MTLPSLDPIVDFLFEAGQLSRTARTGYALLRLPEQNVADHSFRVALIAMTLGRLSAGVDVGKISAMALIHDLPETRTLDQNGLTKKYVSTDRAAVVRDQTVGLPFGDEVCSLLEEYELGQSMEAKLVRDADQIELLLALRERSPLGSDVDRGWIERTMGRVQTEVGRRLAESIVAADPDRWWNR